MDKKELANRLLKEFKLDCFDDEGYVQDKPLDEMIELFDEYLNGQSREDNGEKK
jgi:hypothetical protein